MYRAVGAIDLYVMMANLVNLYNYIFLHSVLPPVIDSDPVDTIVLTGHTATFSVSASGGLGLLRYQWYFGGTPLNDISEKISGSTTNSLAIIDVQSGDTSQGYTVVVLNSVGVNVTSNTATLSICEFVCVGHGHQACSL